MYKTNDTFDYLNDKYEDELDTKCYLIFLALGAITGFESYYRDLDHFKEFTGNGGLIILWILSIVFGAGLSVLVGRYFLTYMLYGLGKLLRGKGEVIDIRVVIAYSMIPIFFKLPVILYLGLSVKFNVNGVFEYWYINVFYFLIWIWTLKIMIQGIIKFNKFGYGKAVITISPLLIVVLGLYTFIFIINH